MPSDEEEVEEQKWECFAAGRGCATSCPWGAVTLYLAWFPPGSRARAPRSHSFPSSETWVCRKEMKWWYIKHFLLFFSSEIWWVESPQQIQTSWLRGPSSFFYPYFLPLDIHCRAPVSCLRWVKEHKRGPDWQEHRNTQGWYLPPAARILLGSFEPHLKSAHIKTKEPLQGIPWDGLRNTSTQSLTLPPSPSCVSA